jgi:hypothetical protein
MSRRTRADLLALAVLLAISVGLFGWRLFPHPGRYTIGGGPDSAIYVWGFAWWSHAIGSWTNPFVSHDLYAPSGVNIAWTPTAPGIDLLFAPVTGLFGPVVANNVASLLTPALSAWTAYLLCRYLSGSFWPSLVGGYLYGFSSPTLRQQFGGHVNLTAVFLFPLVALVLIKYVRGELDRRGLVLRLGPMLGLELWISTEFALTLTIALVLALAVAFLVLREQRPRVRTALGPIAAAYLVGGVVSAPLLVYLALGYRPTSLLDNNYWGATGTDLVQFAVPNSVHAIGGSSFPSISALMPTGDSSYLGIPTLAIALLYAIRWRHSRNARFLVASMLVAAVVALGPTLQVDGHRLVTLPWWTWAKHVPAAGDAFPFRFAVYTSLAAAVVVALWTAGTKGRVYSRPYVLPALAVAALLPAVWRSGFPTFWPERTQPVPAFFATGAYRRCLTPHATVAIFPFRGNGMFWQAETGFHFRLAVNGLQPFPKYGTPMNSFDRDPVVWDLTFLDYARPTTERLLEFAAVHHLERVLASPHADYPTRSQMRIFGRVQEIGGMLVAPACTDPPLTSRNLTAYVDRYDEESRHTPGNIGWCIGQGFNLVPGDLIPFGPLAGAKKAIVVAGTGLTCPPAPPGYVHRGFATEDVPPDTYALYVPASSR